MHLRNVWNHLENAEKDLLLHMALIPPPVSFDDLIATGPASAIQSLRLIEDLVEKRILTIYEPLGQGYYYFIEPDSVQFVLDLSPGESVCGTAEKLAAYFEKKYPDGPKGCLAVAHLVHTSGINPRSVQGIIDAAQYCLKLGSKEASTEYFRLALDKLTDPIRSRAQKKAFIDSTLGLLGAHGHLEPISEQRSLLQKAFHLAKQLDRVDDLARIALIFAQVLKTEGDYSQAAQYFEEGWNLAEQLGEEELLKWAALSTTEFLFWQGRVAQAVERYEQVIGNLEELPSDAATLRACASLGWCYAICGEPARGIGLIDAVRERAIKLGLGEVKIYADLTTVLSVLESRRVEEVEPYLSELLSLPEEAAGHYTLWAANASKALVLYNRGEVEESFRFLKKAHKHSKRLGWPHHRGPWNFELLDGLEKAGMVYEGMNYESEVDRILKWPDIYMQGVGLRFRAMRAIEHRGHRERIDDDLERSLDLLSTAGAKIERARTQLVIASLKLADGEEAQARELIEEAWKVLSAVNDRAFPEDLKKYVSDKDREKLLINTVVEVGTTLGTVRNQSELLQRIINVTMRLTRAERGGFFLLNSEGALRLVASRNLHGHSDTPNDLKVDYEDIREVGSSGNEIVRTGRSGNRTDPQEDAQSGWMICSPIALQGVVQGVLYLDCNLLAWQLPDKDLPLLRAICSQVAVALDNARAYEEIAKLRDRLEEETRVYKMELTSSDKLGDIVGKSKVIQVLRAQIERVAPTDSGVLITGETGVGKGLIARAIHNQSPRAGGPFIPVNTSSVAEGLIASELFGHERGAFTGAINRRLGRFELADRGTLFLDDVDNLSLDIQTRLLRALQDKEFERVGGSETVRSDFRIIAATNQDLQMLIRKGWFRPDLYYRLNVFPIHIAPLKERKEDIPLLAIHFLHQASSKMGREVPSVSRSQMRRLTEYRWPGNVRELKHVMERAVILAEKGSTRLHVMEQEGMGEPSTPEFVGLEEMERAYIIRVLKACAWRVSGKTGAAKVLKLKPTTLYSKMRRLGIKRNVSYEMI